MASYILSRSTVLHSLNFVVSLPSFILLVRIAIESLTGSGTCMIFSFPSFKRLKPYLFSLISHRNSSLFLMVFLVGNPGFLILIIPSSRVCSLRAWRQWQERSSSRPRKVTCASFPPRDPPVSRFASGHACSLVQSRAGPLLCFSAALFGAQDQSMTRLASESTPPAAHLHYFPRSRRSSPPRTYRGHRRASFVSPDLDELVELRARQRTFDGAYIRTALGNFGYALVILKVFTKEFARIGLLYVILAVLLLLIAYRRARRSDHDFADIYRPSPPSTSLDLPLPNTTEANPAAPTASNPTAAKGPRIWGRPFRTSGDVVVLMCLVCCGLYAAIFALVMEL